LLRARFLNFKILTFSKRRKLLNTALTVRPKESLVTEAITKMANTSLVAVIWTRAYKWRQTTIAQIHNQQKREDYENQVARGHLEQLWGRSACPLCQYSRYVRR